MRTDQTAGLNRTARLTGRATPRNYTVIERPREDWIEIGVPALVDQDTWERAQRRLADNKRHASRNSTNPSLLRESAPAPAAATPTTAPRPAPRTRSSTTTDASVRTTTATNTAGSAPTNRCADYLDALVWDHIATLLADPTLIRPEIARRLAHARTADPATAQRQRLESGLSKATEAIKRLIGAYQEQLITLDELRSRMPELRNREAGLRQQIEALDAQLADREIYLTLADNVENFLTGLKAKAATASIAERQRVLRLLVKDVLVSPDKITIRHSIPVRHKPTSTTDTDQEGESSPNCQLRWRSLVPVAGKRRPCRCWTSTSPRPGRPTCPPGWNGLGAGVTA